MADASPRRLRRGVVVALVVLLVALVAGAVVAVVRSRQVDRSVEALCEELGEAQDLDQSLTTLDPTTLDPQVEALQRSAEVAPTDIEPAVSTLATFVGELADEVDRTDGDRGDALTLALEERQDRIAEVTAAGTAVQSWAEASCGLSLVGASTTTTVPDGATGTAPGAGPTDTAP